MKAIIIMNVSTSYFSAIARIYGGCTINGKRYIYHPVKDALIEQKYMRDLRRLKDWDKFVEYVKSLQNK